MIKRKEWPTKIQVQCRKEMNKQSWKWDLNQASEALVTGEHQGSGFSRETEIIDYILHTWASPVVLVVKESACQCGRCKRCGFGAWVGKIPWSRKWHPTPEFLPGNFMGRGAWWATVHGAAKSWMTEWLSVRTCARTHTHTHQLLCADMIYSR